MLFIAVHSTWQVFTGYVELMFNYFIIAQLLSFLRCTIQCNMQYDAKGKWYSLHIAIWQLHLQHASLLVMSNHQDVSSSRFPLTYSKLSILLTNQFGYEPTRSGNNFKCFQFAVVFSDHQTWYLRFIWQRKWALYLKIPIQLCCSK